VTWTPREADKRLRAILETFRASGKDLAETAGLLGCTRETVYEQARRLARGAEGTS
jgi:hypothetical protein